MKGERDLYWIADCAYTEALLHPEWIVKIDLPPLPEPGELLGGYGPVREKEAAWQGSGNCPLPRASRRGPLTIRPAQ